MKNIFKKRKNIKASKKIWTLFFLLFFFLLPLASFASPASEVLSAGGSWVTSGIGYVVVLVLSGIAYIFNVVIGLLLTLMINILIEVSLFSGIVDVPTVETGWTIIRDLCNMFIVLILLFIAFATILRLENYSINKVLPKLLIVALLINFSRTIFALIVDFSQVIMLAFIYPLEESYGGWFIEEFNVQNTNKVIGGDPEKAFTNWETAGAIILGAFAGVVSLIVIIVLLAVLVIRLILLWVYTILSPLIFLGFAFPPIQKYVGSMWQDFIKQVVVGPMLAFFIWLSLTTAQLSLEELNPDPEDIDVLQHAFFQNAELQKYIITVALLIGGLIATQQIGGAVGQAAGRGMEAIRGKYGPTPMRYGRERLEAYKSKKEGERKQKAEAGGQRLYELHKGITQQPKALGTGVKKMAGMPGAGEMWRQVGKGASSLPLISSIKQRKQAKNYHRDKIIESFEQGKEITSDDGNYTYKPDSDNKRVRVMDVNNNEVTSMSKKVADFRRGYKQGYTPAKQVIDEGQKKRVDEKQKEFGHLTASELKEILEDKDASMIDKMTASLMSVQKKNFKEGEEDKFKKAKSYAGQSLSTKKEFNQEADKTYAAWNNSKEQFIKKADTGDIDLNKQDLSQYKEKIGHFAEAAGDNFKEVAKKVSERSSEGFKTIRETLEDKIDSFSDVNMKDSNQKNIRKTYADMEGNFAKAFSTPDGQKDEKAMKDFVRSAKTERLDKMVGALNNEKIDNREKETMEQIIGSTLTEDQIQNYEKKDVPRSNVEQLRKIKQQRGGQQERRG
jgi:hypothetical protein